MKKIEQDIQRYEEQNKKDDIISIDSDSRGKIAPEDIFFKIGKGPRIYSPKLVNEAQKDNLHVIRNIGSHEPSMISKVLNSSM